MIGTGIGIEIEIMIEIETGITKIDLSILEVVEVCIAIADMIGTGPESLIEITVRQEVLGQGIMVPECPVGIMTDQDDHEAVTIDKRAR